MPDLTQLKHAPALPQDLVTDQHPLTIGVLHLGSPVHGVHRYGRIIARELRRFAGVSVIECQHDLRRPGVGGVLDAVRAMRSFSGANVVVMPYCRNGLWGSQRAKLAQLAVVLSGIRVPVVVVLHDIYSPGGRRRSEWWAMAVCSALSAAVIIHGEHERPRLYRLPRADHVRVIPHFIEHRHPFPRDEARSALGVDAEARIVGVLGWIHPRKQYETAVRLLAMLEPDFQLWLIGSPPEGSQEYLAMLKSLARELAVADRLKVTGYIDEEELSLRIAAIDVGLCPYRDASASGSMSTLLSARRPIVANDFALAAELANLAPEAITLVSDDDLVAYRAAVIQIASRNPPPQAYESVLRQRAPDTIATHYLETLRAVAA
jgi:glycosyltransferase involved in cell wall biosynthesis